MLTYSLQYWSNSSNKVNYRRFRAIVFGICLMRIYSGNTRSRDNLAPRNRIPPHEMNRQLCSIHHTLIIDIGAFQIWRGWYTSSSESATSDLNAKQTKNLRVDMPMVQNIYRALVNDSSVCKQSVNPTPRSEYACEGSCLRLVYRYICLPKFCVRSEGCFQSFSFLAVDVE